MRPKGKVSIITGGAQGIGLATAHKLATEGAIVIVADVQQAAVDAAVQALRRDGASAERSVVIGFARTCARELGPKGIGCNAVCPGFIATPVLRTIPGKGMAQMTERVPMKRLGRPEEVADVYAYLAADEASDVDGAVIEVAGGLTV